MTSMQHAGIYAFFIGDKTSGAWRISAISTRHSTIGFDGARPMRIPSGKITAFDNR